MIRAVGVFGVVAIVLLAGCSGTVSDAGTSEPVSTPATPGDVTFPDGFSVDGVENTSRTVGSSSTAMWASSYTIETVVEQTIDDGGTVQRHASTWKGAVEPGDRAVRTVRTTFEKRQNRSVYWEGTTRHSVDGSGVVRSETDPDGMDRRLLTETWRTRLFTGGLDYAYDTTRTADDGTARFVYSAEGFVNESRYYRNFGVTNETTTPASTLVVDENGVIRELTYRNTHYYPSGETHEWDVRITVTDVGRTAVDRPDWVSE
jgi:hypothetical protein